MEKRYEKDTKKKRGDHFTSEFHTFKQDVPGSLKDFVGALVTQPRNPNHRPVYKVWIGRTESVLKEVLRAEGPDGDLIKIQVPQEEVVCTGDVLVDAIDIRNLDIPSMTKFLTDLQKRQEREEIAWERAQKERKRERRRRYQKRKRARKKAERQAAAKTVSQDQVASRRSDTDQLEDDPKLDQPRSRP